jgi:phosphopantetheine--protein transferase-like protein
MRALFTDDEYAACTGARHAASRFAGTWCAKEATVKALSPWLSLEPRQVVVSHTGDGRPSARVAGIHLADHGLEVRLSISETETLALACAVASGPVPSERAR